MKVKPIISVVFALLLTLGCSVAYGQNVKITSLGMHPFATDENVTYTVSDLGTLGGTSSSAFGINNRGQVTGTAALPTGQSHAFLWQDRKMVDLGTLDGLAFSEGSAINNRGQVAGDSNPAGGSPFSGTLWANGEIIALGSLGGGMPSCLQFMHCSFGRGINNRGQVVGGSRTPAPTFENHAFLWEDGVMTDLGALPGVNFSIATGINNRGQVVGTSGPFEGAPDQHAFLWEEGGMIDLGTLGGTFSVARGINRRSQAVGVSTTADEQQHAFLWHKGAMTDLGTLGGTSSIAWHINSRGHIVGGADIPSGEEHAFIWEDGVMTDLNTLIPENSGWILVEASGINAAGHIVGFGVVNGQTHAFLLTPDDD